MAVSIIIAAIFALPGFDSPGWLLWRHSASLFFSGTAIVCLAIYLRGPREVGWNWLMLIGTLVALSGILFAPATLLLGRL